MTNRLLRREGRGIEGKVLVRSLSDLPEGIGSTLLEYGDTGWCSWDMAKVLVAEGKVEIIEFEQALTDTVKGRECIGDPLDLPGFVCMECWEQGVLVIYAKEAQMTGHMGSHRPGHGYPKGRPRKPKEETGREKRKGANGVNEKDRRTLRAKDTDRSTRRQKDA